MAKVGQDRKRDGRDEGLIGIIAKYSSSRFYEQFLSLLNSFVRPKLLLPELYGLWHTLITIPGYAVYSNLGVHASMRYRIPAHESRQESEEVRRIMGSVACGSLFTKIVIALILVVIAFAFDTSMKVRIGLLTMACVVILEWYIGYYTAILEATYRFQIITSVNYIKTTIAFCASVVLIYLYNIYGLYAAALLTLISTVVYLRWKHPLEHLRSFDCSLFAGLVRQGFPIMIFNLCTDLISQSDKLIIAGIIGTEYVGYYAIAIMVHHFVMNIPVAARSVNETRLMRNLGNHSEQEVLSEYFFKPLLTTAYLMPFLIGSVIISMPPVIPAILPRYSPGVIPAQILTFGCYFFSLFFVTRGIIVARQLQVKASVIMFAVASLHVVTGIICLKMGFGINGMAVVSCLSLLNLFVSIFIFLMRRVTVEKPVLRSHITVLCLPLPVMLAFLAALLFLFRDTGLNAYLTAFLQLVLYNSGMFLFLLGMRKRIPSLRGLTMRDM